MAAASQVLPAHVELAKEAVEKFQRHVRAPKLKGLRAREHVTRAALAVVPRFVKRAVASPSRAHHLLELPQTQSDLLVGQVGEDRMAHGKVELRSKMFEGEIAGAQDRRLFDDTCLLEKLAAHVQVHLDGVDAEVPAFFEVREQRLRQPQPAAADVEKIVMRLDATVEQKSELPVLNQVMGRVLFRRDVMFKTVFQKQLFDQDAVGASNHGAPRSETLGRGVSPASQR